MAAGTLDLTIEQGATFRRTVIWREPNVDPNTPGPVKNLTGYKAQMELRTAIADRSDSALLLELTTENGGLTITGVDGRIDIHMTGLQTGQITVKKGVYDLFLIPPGDEDDPVKLLKGAFFMDKKVTVI